MTNMLRIHLFLPLCTVLFAASGLILHAAPIRKLPDEPEEKESSAVIRKLPDEPETVTPAAEKSAEKTEKKPTKTESEAIKEITARLDKMIVPY